MVIVFFVCRLFCMAFSAPPLAPHRSIVSRSPHFFRSLHIFSFCIRYFRVCYYFAWNFDFYNYVIYSTHCIRFVPKNGHSYLIMFANFQNFITFFSHSSFSFTPFRYDILFLCVFFSLSLLSSCFELVPVYAAPNHNNSHSFRYKFLFYTVIYFYTYCSGVNVLCGTVRFFLYDSIIISTNHLP